MELITVKREPIIPDQIRQLNIRLLDLDFKLRDVYNIWKNENTKCYSFHNKAYEYLNTNEDQVKFICLVEKKLPFIYSVVYEDCCEIYDKIKTEHAAKINGNFIFKKFIPNIELEYICYVKLATFFQVLLEEYNINMLSNL